MAFGDAMPAKIQLPDREQFERDCGVMRGHQLVRKYAVSKNTIKLWKKVYGLSNVGVKGERKIVWDVMDNGCWNCVSHKPNNKGYPQGSAKLGRRSIARVMYQRHVGEIPEGLVIRHKCDNTMCINPGHLETGTMSDNMSDRDERGRAAQGENCGASKLTVGQVEAIRRLKGQMSQRVAAKLFGVSGSNVWHIWNNRTWRGVRE